ncbi:MAG: septum formation initiator family protein [Trichlorobacter sp.]
MQKIRITRRTYLIPAGCLAFILFFTVFGERGLLRIYEMRQEKTRINGKVSELKSENDKLRTEIAALHNDRYHLERIARKDLGLVKPNEIIYQFPPAGK